MKSRYNLPFKGILFLGLICFTSAPAFAQFDLAGEILRSGQEDANILLREYFKPVGNGFGADLNSGWFSTAKTHQVLGFDVTVNASMALVPDIDQAFNVVDLESQFNTLEYLGGPQESPTIAGDETPGSTVGATFFNPATASTETLFEFDMPEGSGFPYVPAPMIQASVGIVKNTDITLRWLPQIPLPNDLELNLFGLGVKHGLNQWLPGGKLLPVDLSVQAGFTNLDASVNFDVQPEVDAETENPFPASTWEGQKAEFSASAFTINALVGKTLPFISVFAGVGYETSTVDISTPGTYPIVVPNTQFNPSDPNSQPKIVDTVENPVDLSYDGSNSIHGLIGARLRLFVLNISASYTIADYPVGQIGIGFGFR
ncbi:MAG: DUF6588 family protein [Balneolaceae bacterium]|nr:DUF6588 family protein [Balneolaceae bacterium]